MIIKLLREEANNIYDIAVSFPIQDFSSLGRRQRFRCNPSILPA